MSAALGHNGPATSALKKITTPSTGKRKRTVPDELRRRAAASCDRCKLRRSKCIKEPSNSQCTNCQAAGVECESKLPRKQRLYGSVESLSLRYRVLDALAKGLFPDVDTGDVEKLLEIGREKGIQGLPSLGLSTMVIECLRLADLIHVQMSLLRFSTFSDKATRYHRRCLRSLHDLLPLEGFHP